MYFGHISLDVWNTLITPNPEFANVRNATLADKFGVHVDVIKRIHQRTKIACEHELALKYGLAVSSIHIWKLFIRYLAEDQNYPEINIRNKHSCTVEVDLYNKVQELFEKYPPIVLPVTIEAVRKIFEAGACLHIASNTNYICGYTMRSFLNKHFGQSTFRSYTYSDEVGIAKPSAAFFYHVLLNMTNTNYDHFHAPIHIGDDSKYDTGAASVGIRPIVIKDPTDTARTLHELLDTIQS